MMLEIAMIMVQAAEGILIDIAFVNKPITVNREQI